MIIPIRCFTCNKLIADKWEKYKKKLEENKDKEGKQKKEMEEILEKEFGLKRYCCKRMLTTHVELINDI
jgi:DNA-directed RNA polymerase subunit N (RpoN/RPB10)